MTALARAMLLALLLPSCCAATARAEIDERYDGGAKPPLSEYERESVRRAIELEMGAERARAADEARRFEDEMRRIAAEREARPVAVKLLEARCMRCHNAERIETARYGPIGWHATILRMQWINGAFLAPGERGVLAGYLAATRSAPALRVAAEWLALFATTLWLLWCGRSLIRRVDVRQRSNSI